MQASLNVGNTVTILTSDDKVCTKNSVRFSSESTEFGIRGDEEWGADGRGQAVGAGG